MKAVCTCIIEKAVEVVSRPFVACYLEMDAENARRDSCIVCGAAAKSDRFCSDSCKKTFEYHSTAV